MAKVKCHQCKEIIKGGAKIQAFHPEEPTTIEVFCSEACKTKWLATLKK